MKKIRIALTLFTLLAIIFQTVSAAEVPLEAAPCHVSKESISVTENLIGGILTEVQNGMGYGEANGKAQATICGAIMEGKTQGIGYGELMSIARNSIFLYRDMYLRPELYREKEEALAVKIGDIIAQVKNGKCYEDARKEAYQRICPGMGEEYIDRIYLDIPSADFVDLTLARKLLLRASINQE